MDTSFYHGRYYIYYGIIPVLVFMLPFRLLTGGDLWLGTAGECAGLLAFLALAWFWLRARRDLFPRSSSLMVFSSIMALGMATGLLSIARRPMMYEFAIASGCLFVTLMLHSLYSSLSSPRRPFWMAAAGVFLGLAVGCRPTFLFTILAPAWVILSGAGEGEPWKAFRKRPAALIAPAAGFAAGFGVIFSGLLLYNYLRFSSIFDFGYNYLLQDPVADLKHIWSASYFWFNLRLYYAGPLEWSRFFPFAWMGPLPPWPKSYYGVADLYGILKYAPVTWFLLAVPLALRRGTRAGAKFAGAAVGMVFLAYLGPGLCDLFFGNSALRYAVDFLPNLVLVSAFGACALEQAMGSGAALGGVRAAWLAACLFSATVAAILSIPLEGSLTVHRGNAYLEKVARALNVPTYLYDNALGWRYGPVRLQVVFPSRPRATVEKLVETPNAVLLAEYLPGNRLRLGIRSAESGYVLWGGEEAVAKGRASTLFASFGSLYPTAEHPYYLDSAPGPISRSAVAVELNGRPVLKGLLPLAPVDCRDIRIADGRPADGWFSGNVTKVERTGLPNHGMEVALEP
ncbi:MAG TPA: hypothetical protein VGG37_01720, partial [Opitutaceae bacterium]